jgi:hypothetical protein
MELLALSIVAMIVYGLVVGIRWLNVEAKRRLALMTPQEREELEREMSIL